MFISLAYVDRQIARDREEEAEAGKRGEGEGEGENEETEWWDGERGVSGAMSRVFDVQVGGNYRCTLLSVGCVHLWGLRILSIVPSQRRFRRGPRSAYVVGRVTWRHPQAPTIGPDKAFEVPWDMCVK